MYSRDQVLALMRERVHHPAGMRELLQVLKVARDDSVAVHGFVEIRPGDVDVAARLERTFGNDEAVAGRMCLQPAGVQIHLFREAEPVAADLNEIAGGDERFDVALERRAFVARNLEQLKKLPHAGGMVYAITHEREHLVTSKHIFWAG